jgi:cold shock CspA family protein
MTSRVSGDLVYWNAHTGFGEIDLDDGRGRIGIYRVDLLRAGVRQPQAGDRFHFNIGVAASGVKVAIDLCRISEGRRAA